MSKVVNLRQVRKQKARQEKAAKAADNRVAYGLRKSEKQVSRAKKTLEENRLEGHRLNSDEEE